MDAEYFDIYRDQVQTLLANRLAPMPDNTRFYAVVPEAVRLVNDAMATALRDLGPKFGLRPDAMLFLLINLTYLVAVPVLSHSAAPDLARETTRLRLRETLVGDIYSILDAAVQRTEEHGELSAASVLYGAANTLADLGLKNWRLWDRRR